MTILQYVLLGFAPGLFWLWYFRRKDDFEPEPRLLLIKVFAYGGLSALAMYCLGPLIQDVSPELPGGWKGRVLEAFVLTAFLEESVKLCAFFFGAWIREELDEPLDGLIYGTAIGLGFASVENVIYLLGTGETAIVVQRAFTATLGHVAFSGSLGFFFGLAKFRRGGWRHCLMLIGGLAALLFHGSYDYFLIGTGPLSVMSLILVLPLILILFGLQIHWSRARSPEYHPDRATELESRETVNRGR